MTTNSKNLRDYADSARRAYSALACDVNVELSAGDLADGDLDMYLAERCMYLAEYKFALIEARAPIDTCRRLRPAPPGATLEPYKAATATNVMAGGVVSR